MPRPPFPSAAAPRTKRSKIRCCSAGAMPGPRSRTVTRATVAARRGHRDGDRRAVGRIAGGVLEQVERAPDGCACRRSRPAARRRAARPRPAPRGRAGRCRRFRSTTARDRRARGRSASWSRSARVRSIRSSTSRESRRTCARANARSAGGIGWPASSCRSASCSVIASGPSAFLISCAAAPNTAASDRLRRSGGRFAHGRSKMAEIPWPTPMHMRREAVARAARRELVHQRASTRRAPDAPSGWPIAMAPPLTLTRVGIEAQLAHARDRLGGERLVQLDRDPDRAAAIPARASALRVAGIGPGPSASARRPRRRTRRSARAAGGRRDARALRPTRAARAAAPSLMPRRVAGGHRPASLAEHGRQRREIGGGRLGARVLVDVDRLAARPSCRGSRHGHQLVGEAPGGVRGRPAPLAASSANASCASRVTPYFSATSSAVSPSACVPWSASMRGLTNRQPSVLSWTVDVAARKRLARLRPSPAARATSTRRRPRSPGRPRRRRSRARRRSPPAAPSRTAG